MKKNIIIITMLPLWSMNKGSGGKALYNTVDLYNNSDYNVFIVTNQKNEYIKFKNIKEKNVYYINQEWYENKASLIGKINIIKYYREFEKETYKRIKEIVNKIGNKEKIILYAYEVQAVKSAKKVSKKYRLPLVTRFQGTIMANIPSNLYYKIRKYPHIQALSTKADLVIMTDDGTQGDKVLDNYKNNSKRLFIRNGVNILDQKIEDIDKEQLRKELNIPAGKTVLLTVSRLEGWKKVERSINALNEIKNNKEYCLVIVGEGTERKNLEQLSEKLNLKDQIRFTGAIKNEDVKKYMQLADIFLSFYDLSNVGNPLLEALCLGKPIITYNVGDTYKIIDGKNGILLDDVSPKNIANNIEEINKKEKLEEYSKNAYKYAMENLYSWKRRMEIEKKEIDKLINL